MTSDGMKRALNLSSVGNARELGGCAAGGRTVRQGLLLRTASLSGISREDVSRLESVYRVATVVDFRMDVERRVAPEPVIPGAENRFLPVIEGIGDSGELEKLLAPGADRFEGLKAAREAGMLDDDLYLKFLFSDRGRAAYRDFFECLLSLPEGRACLWHCTDGKDRTGVAAMLVLTALGADREAVMEDYLLTNVYNAEKLAAVSERLADRLPTPELRELALFDAGAVYERYMANALDGMAERCGSAEGYLTRALGLDGTKLGLLREKFLK